MERIEEFNIKMNRVRGFLDDSGADGAAFTRTDHFAWLTCGGSSYVNSAGEGGVGTVVVTRDRAVLITNRIEERRLADEEIAGLPIEVVALPWQADREAFAAKEYFRGGKFFTDIPFAGLAPLVAAFDTLMYELTAAEIARYRELGRLTGEALQAACRKAVRGISENEIAGLLARNCLASGVHPTVMLVAADERLKLYRHPLPTENRVDKTVMVVVCGRRHGLIASCTRIVSVGEPDAELVRRHEACIRVDLAFNTGTLPGRRVADVFAEAQEAYREGGFDGEWNLHHQGGGTGYKGRNFFGSEHSSEVVSAYTAYAWNPSITGTKCEDTMLVLPGGNEFITQAADWPRRAIEYKGRVVERPDILAV